MGRAYELVHPDLATLKDEIDIGFFKCPENPVLKQAAMNDFQSIPSKVKGSNKGELIRDWLPATDNECGNRPCHHGAISSWF